MAESPEMKSLYAMMGKRIAAHRSKLDRPLTLAEKILASHLVSPEKQQWERGSATLVLQPDRVAMQDVTGQMVLLQFIMSGRERTAVPASLHCDHLVVAEKGAQADVAAALEQQKEVYDFLRSGSRKFGIHFWKPGSGIIHQALLENYAFPGGLMIGSDSHTPNAGGLGMLAVGVGGADVAEVMSGLPWRVLHPKLIGVRLKGSLRGWASPKDVILRLCGLLTVEGGTNCIIEYFGPGAESISATGKAAICNMGAEVGATCSVFPFDARMAAYLRATGRKEAAELAEKNAGHLIADSEVMEHPEKFYDRVIELDLSSLEPHIAGPHTPDRVRPLSALAAEAAREGWPAEVSSCLIGSCTNSSYEDIARAADVVGQALGAGLKLKVPLLISPGSEQITRTLRRDGLLKVFEKAGAIVLANACGPCIGQWKRSGAPKKANVILTTFNRNFRARNDGNPETLAFIASPEIVAAYAFAGSLSFNPTRDSRPLRFIPPKGDELPAKGFEPAGDEVELPAKDPGSVRIEVKKDSERLQMLAPFPAWDGKDFTGLPILIKTVGKTTTDHISPAGEWLRFRGHLDRLSDNMFLGAVNAFTGKPGTGRNALTGESGLAIAAIARDYKAKGVGSVVVGGDNYGEGSSREHAAMSPRHLNVKAVIAKSFARIHETNLKKQGILPLTFSSAGDYDLIGQDDRVSITGLAAIAPRKAVRVVITRPDGTARAIAASHSLTEEEIGWFRAGSALNTLRWQGKRR